MGRSSELPGDAPRPPGEPRGGELARRRPRRVRKRDGREVAFDAGRIADAVRRAQDAVGEDDPPFAREVADVVGLTLAARYGAGSGPAGVPTVEDVQDLVEQALVEMGRARLAKAYILYRDRRARARDALTVLERPDRTGRMPWVRDGGGTSPWNQARIVAALMAEADLPREIAEDVAERVEGRVHDAGLRRLSTALIRELVDNELMAMGLETALHRQEPVGIPRHDLRQLIARPRAEGDLAQAVASEVLARFALSDVLDERTADLHKGGALFVANAARPHLALQRALPVELLLRREPSPHSGFELLAELAPLLAGVTRGVVLEGLHRVTAPLLRASRSSSAGLRDLLAALGALAAATRKRIDLAAPGGRGGTLVARLLREVAELCSAGLATPGLFLDWEELASALEHDPSLGEVAEDLLARDVLVPVWHAPDLRWAGPGCRRRRGELGALACAGAVALNLPRLARQAGPWREDALFEALVARVQSALDALESLDRFQRAQPAARDEALRERRGFALTPVGLLDALRILGDGVVRADQGARLLGVLADAARRFGEQRGLSVVVSPFFGEAASHCFARADARVHRASQRRLFADLPAPEADRDRPYSLGFPPPAERPGGTPPGVAIAELCATVRVGALAPFRLPAWSGDGSPSPLLDTWRGFHAHRFRPRSETEAGRPAPRAGAGHLFR